MTDHTLCPACGQRRGRRACPALGRSICAVCCGTKRLTEIACPADCGYLASARQHPAAAVQKRREMEGRFLAGVVRDLSETPYHLFLFLQMAVVKHAAHAVPALTDADVAAAARAMADTLDTAARGIIYEHQVASLPAQRLATDLKAAIETLAKDGRGPRDADVALALKTTVRGASEAAAALGGDRAWLELLASLFQGSAPDAPEGDAPAAEPGRIILP
jgi:hypothetical protein